MNTRMPRILQVVGLVALLAFFFVTAATAREQVRSELQPLTIEVVGESISRTSPERVWYYRRISNPNPRAVGFELDLPEYGEDGGYLGGRTEAPCDAWTYLDIFRQMTMVPAHGSIIVFYPPVYGGTQDPEVRIDTSCELESFWGYTPSRELELIRNELDGDFLTLTVGASEELVGRAVVQVQVVLYREGRVVDMVYTNSNEFNLLTAGSTEDLYLNLSREAQFDNVEVNILGLAHQ